MLGQQAPSAEQPVVMIGRERSRRIVKAVDTAAKAAGLQVGMPASKAQALVPGLIMQDIKPKEDLCELERLALWFLRNYAPVVSTDPPDGIVIDTTGADHLHGDETLMLMGMINRLRAMGFEARAAISDSWGASYALARFGAAPFLVVPEGGGGEAVAKLPIAALRLDSGTVAQLRGLGFERVGELAATPRAPLALRFGPEIGRRLDQAYGRLAEPIEPLRPVEAIEVRRAFAEPISAAETIARYVRRLVVALCQSLEAQGIGVRRLDLIAHRVDSGTQVIRAGTARPVRDHERLSRLLCDRIEKIDPGFGIEMLTLRAVHTEPLEAVQMASSLVEEPEADISGLVDTIGNRGHSVYRVAALASDVPERSFQRIPALAEDDERIWPLHWPRPVRLLAAPEPIQAIAMLPDHPPVSFTWRGIRRSVKRADGPERIRGEWWRRDQERVAVRDYFAVEDETGARYWIFRRGDGEHADSGDQGWFMHGIFA